MTENIGTANSKVGNLFSSQSGGMTFSPAVFRSFLLENDFDFNCNSILNAIATDDPTSENGIWGDESFQW